MPSFSIVIPCWNAAGTVDQTLQSVVAQGFGDWEAILVDDGSTDGTADILRDWQNRDRRFRVVHSPNGGPSRARNLAAFEYAQADYLAFLDADDVWAKNKLEVMANILIRRIDLDGVYARASFFRGSPGVKGSTSKILNHPLSPTDVLKENAVCTMSNLVVRTGKFKSTGGFDPHTVHGEDIGWLVAATASGLRIEGVDEILVYYRVTDDGLSRDVEKMHAGWANAVSTARQAGVVIDASELRLAEAVHLRYLARRALRFREPGFTALKLTLRGVACSPAGFFGDPWRGGMTFLASCAAPLTPSWLRRLTFSV
jgi:glycosyltransferase involved in cell wall biosynthesis